MSIPLSAADADARFIGIDLGTSGCRAVAIDRDARQVSEARTGLPDSRRSGDGGSEQDPEDWWQAVTDTLVAVVGRARGTVRAICVDGTSSTLLLAGMDGRPCTPAVMYDDTRAGTEAIAIADVASDTSAARGASSALAKLLFLQRHYGDADAAFALHQADWISGRLRGHYGFSDENNCLKLGYDPVARRWPDWLRVSGADMRLLPQVLPVGRVLGRVAPDIARRFAVPRDTQIVAGTTDSNAAALAAGIGRPGDAVTSLGSTLVLKVVGERPVTAAKFGVYGHRIGDLWLVGGASNTGGAVLRAFFSDREIVELSRKIDPSRDSGLDYYPLRAVGERFPLADPNLKPRLQPRPDNDVLFLHGLLEGIARIERQGYLRLADLGAPYPSRVLTAGGGAVNAAWSALRARVLGVPVERALHGEASFGCALLALRANENS